VGRLHHQAGATLGAAGRNASPSSHGHHDPATSPPLPAKAPSFPFRFQRGLSLVSITRRRPVARLLSALRVVLSPYAVQVGTVGLRRLCARKPRRANGIASKLSTHALIACLQILRLASPPPWNSLAVLSSFAARCSRFGSAHCVHPAGVLSMQPKSLATLRPTLRTLLVTPSAASLSTCALGADGPPCLGLLRGRMHLDSLVLSSRG
jgi:hypothetical protein